MTHVPFEELPPEMQAQIADAWNKQQEHVQRHSMALESSRHRMLNFLESLDEEGLHALRGIVQAMVSDTDNETAGYYMGITAGLLARKGLCLMCNIKHETVDDLAHNMEADNSEVTMTASEAERIARRDTGHIADRTRLFTEEETQDLVDYTLRLDPEGGYICSGCGLVKYATLEDRKLRDPGPSGCHGCTQTAKWGGNEPTFDPDLAPKD